MVQQVQLCPKRIATKAHLHRQKQSNMNHTFITRLLAIVPIRSGPANGSIHVANIKTRKSHPDNANQRKKIVYKKKTSSKPRLSYQIKCLHNQHSEYTEKFY